jgi:tetratricopeptide (TPR) repeat protein
MGRGLARLLAEKFLAGAHADASLSSVSDMAVAQVGDARIVFRYIADVFRPFGPGPHHKLIPHFRWCGIATLNYDEIIERAFEDAKKTLNIGRSDDFLIEDARSDRDATILLKLHGCITRADDLQLPLILTPSSYADHRSNRHKLFNTLEGWAAERSLVFCGTTIDDSDIQLLLRDIVHKYKHHPRFYLVEPFADAFVTQRWASHGITVIPASFSDFLQSLDAASVGIARGVMLGEPTIPLLDLLGLGKGGVSAEIKRRLVDGVDVVSNSLPAAPLAPRMFYRGVIGDWTPIINNLDCPRDIADDILIDVVLSGKESRPADLIVIKAEAGAGKSVLLRRLAWRTTIEHHKIALWARSGAGLDPTTLETIAPALKERLFVFVDDLLQNASAVAAVLRRARAINAPITVIGTARSNQWNLYGYSLAPFVDDEGEYELSRLSHNEIRRLLSLLETHDSLGVLKGVPSSKRFDEVIRVADSQLLVFLHEATSGLPLQEIIKNEYEQIVPDQAQSLYLSICLLNRTGTPVRAGLIARVHGVTFEDFQERFFKPLDQVVVTSKVRAGRDVEYRARHPVIAEMVVRQILLNPDDLFDRVIRLVQYLNTAYATDQESFHALTKARTLLQMFPDELMIEQIYETAEKGAPDDGHLALQHARFEMLRASPNFARARSIVAHAEELLPNNPLIQHVSAELEYQNAIHATDPLARTAALRLADNYLRGLYGKGATPHAWHTKCKIEILRLQTVLEDPQRSEDDEVRAIQSAEDVVSAALQGWPDDALLLDSESKLATLLSQDERALKALERAAKNNLRNTNIVARLSRLYRNRNEKSKAYDLLRDAAAANPGQPRYSFERAMLLMDDGGDGKQIEDLLRRSFSEGDRNHFAQFLHARQMYINGNEREGRRRFKELSASAGWAPQVGGNNWIWTRDGKPVVAFGRVSRVEKWYGTIERDGTGDWIYVPRDSTGAHPLIDMSLGTRVRFQIGFTYRGPFAVEILRAV